MALQQPHTNVSTVAPRATTGGLSALRRELSFHDWLVLSFVVALNGAALLAPSGPTSTNCLLQVFGMLLFLLATLLLVRSGWLRHRFSAALLYRIGIYGSVQLSYFILGGLLPLLHPQTLDQQLYELDLTLFGFEPALAMDPLVSPGRTEWFAFFYYTYFFILAAHVIPILFGCRSQRRLGEFALGMLLVFCLGHTGYMLVPGYGPYWGLSEHFHNPLPNGFWTDLVMATVASGGSKLDIFPSLHTAAPTFITLYAFRHRHLRPYRYTWVVLAFVATNIIVATMYLRWHYVIDVVVGLLLAVLASVLSVRITAWDLARREGTCSTPHWPLFFTSRISEPPQRPGPPPP
jgi:membrane-associated phospholipid phosphatase